MLRTPSKCRCQRSQVAAGSVVRLPFSSSTDKGRAGLRPTFTSCNWRTHSHRILLWQSKLSSVSMGGDSFNPRFLGSIHGTLHCPLLPTKHQLAITSVLLKELLVCCILPLNQRPEGICAVTEPVRLSSCLVSQHLAGSRHHAFAHCRPLLLCVHTTIHVHSLSRQEVRHFL
eukprot:scpid30809/ scgid13309/ 